MSDSNVEYWPDVIGHYYLPIPLYNGKVLKYEGLADTRNREWMMKKPGMIMLDEYKGDRIYADTHEPHPYLI